MKNLPHGIISLFFTAAALLLGIFAISAGNLIYGIVYVVILITGFLVVIYSYCTKCSGRFNCGHVIFGKIAQRMPKRKSSSYSNLDFLGVMIPLILMMVIPQFWLWKTTWMFAAFWILMIVSVLEINRYVCSRCANSKCLLCRNECVKKMIITRENV